MLTSVLQTLKIAVRDKADIMLILGVSGCIFLPQIRRKFKGKIITNIDEWKTLGSCDIVMGIKDPYHKEKMAEELHARGASFLSVLTPWTIVPDHYSIGEGCVISNYSFKEGSVFDEFVTMINVMSEGSKVGKYTTIDALSNITNSEIGSHVMIGSHSFIMAHKKIEDGSVIFPGSMVFGNVKQDNRIAGIPANKARYKMITGANTADKN